MADQLSHSFPSTHWTMVCRAGAGDSQRREALGKLLQRYMPPLRAYLIARFRFPFDRTDDLLHAFLADKVIEEDIVRQADRTRGKFRSFLLRALENFAIAQIRKEKAGHRMPAAPMVALGEDVGLVPTAPEVADMFDLAWGRQVIDLALQAMRRECEVAGRSELWAVFEGRVLRPTLQGEEPMPLGDFVEQLGVTPAKASNLLITSKRMFARNLREVVSGYAVDEEDVEDELRQLKQILSRSGA